MIFLILAGMLAVAVTAAAQSPLPGGRTPVQGFNVSMLIGQLSLYLPPEATQGMYSGFGGRGGAAGGQRPQLQFTRDSTLFLTKDQIVRLLPVLTALRENPLPTPSKASQVQADVNGILTAAQKAEYEQFRKAMQDIIQRYREQAAANGTGSGSRGGDQAGQAQGGAQNSGAQMTPLQRRQHQLDAFIKVLQSRRQLGS
jgi:hypothetical protein